MIKIFEKYNDIKEVKNLIFLKAIENGDIEMVNFFIKKGADLNGEGILFEASFNDDIFRYLLKKGASVEEAINSEFKDRMRELSVQKILIDFGHEVLIEQTVGLNRRLKDDPKYADLIDQVDDMKKYNL